MNGVTAVAAPSANLIQCPTSNSRAVCLRKAAEWTAVPSVNMIVFRGQKKAIENTPSQTITIRLPRIQYWAGFTRQASISDTIPVIQLAKPRGGKKSPGPLTVANAIAVSSGARRGRYWDRRSTCRTRGRRKNHQHPRIRQDEHERDLRFLLHDLLLWFRRYDGCSDRDGTSYPPRVRRRRRGSPDRSAVT